MESIEVSEKKYRNLAIIILSFLILVVGVWGSFAPLSSAIPAIGKVSVSSNNRVIQHLDGGIIKSILVKEGDYVKENNNLILLEDDEILAKLNTINTQYIQSIAELSRLEAEDDENDKVIFPDIMNKLCNEFSCEKIKKAQINEFNTRKKYIKSEIALLEQKISQHQNKLEGLKEKDLINQELLRSYTNEIKEWESLFKKQLVDKKNLREIKRKKIQLDNEISSIKLTIIQIQNQIKETNTQIEITNNTFKRKIAENLSDLQTKVTNLKAQRDTLLTQLKRTKIKSPVDGIVTNLQLHTIGGIISPAKAIMEIVPFNDNLVIECKVTASERSVITMGLNAEIRFPGFSHVKSLNEVTGKVIHIAPDAQLDQQSGALYYPVKVVVTEQGKEELKNNSLTIQPGIPAEVMIITGERTMLDYLIKPLKSMFVKSFNEK